VPLRDLAGSGRYVGLVLRRRGLRGGLVLLRVLRGVVLLPWSTSSSNS